MDSLPNALNTCESLYNLGVKAMKKLLIFTLILLVETVFSFPLDPVRIFLQDKSPESGQMQIGELST